MNIVGLIFGLFLLLFGVYQIIGLVKDVKKKHSLKKDKQNQNNIKEVNEE